MTNVRDIEADYRKAYLAEYESLKRAGLDDRADVVADILKSLGHEVRPRPAVGDKQRAVSDEPLAQAVEGARSPKRRKSNV